MAVCRTDDDITEYIACDTSGDARRSTGRLRPPAWSARMIAVSARLPARGQGRPPVILVHGAANSAAVWTYWSAALAADGWPTYAIDLRGHGDSSPTDLSR